MILLDTNSPHGVSEEALQLYMLQGLTLAEALHAIAEVVEVGDGGVDSEFCLVPDIHALADAVEM